MAAFDIDKAFEVPKGQAILLVKDGANMVALAAGDDDPNASGGTPAPIGSLYFRSDGRQWVKAMAIDTGWTLSGLGSPVVTQTADFGKSGVSPGNNYLNRAGNVSSNISGVPVIISAGKIKAIAVSCENPSTFDVEFYEHEGDFISPVLLYTIELTATRFKRDDTLDISVSELKQIAAKVVNGSASNVGATVGMKGLSL